MRRGASWPAAGPAPSSSPATSTPAPRWKRRWRDNPYVVADNVVPRIGVLAPDSARAAIRAMFLSHVIGGKHLSKRADFTAMVTGATPDVVLTGVELLARGLDREHPGVGRRGRRRRRRRHHRRALRGRARPRGGDPLARGRRHHAGHPHGRGRPRHALVGHLDGRGRRARRTSSPRPRCATPTPASCRRPTRNATRTSASPPLPSAWPCAGTPAAARSSSAPTAASSSAPARTCARSTSSSARAACCATAGPASRNGCSAAASARSRAAGSCPCGRGFVVDRDYVLAAAGLLVDRHPEAAYRLVSAAGCRGSSLSPVSNGADETRSDAPAEAARGRRAPASG